MSNLSSQVCFPRMLRSIFLILFLLNNRMNALSVHLLYTTLTIPHNIFRAAVNLCVFFRILRIEGHNFKVLPINQELPKVSTLFLHHCFQKVEYINTEIRKQESFFFHCGLQWAGAGPSGLAAAWPFVLSALWMVYSLCSWLMTTGPHTPVITPHHSFVR